MATRRYDAVIVGSGPNGLAGAVALARAGQRVLVLEAEEQPGGGARTAELTLPGFHHDICSAVHPLGIGSPFFRQLPLHDFGLEWIQPPLPLAHPFDDGSAAVLARSVAATAAGLGADGRAYRALMGPMVAHWQALLPEVLQPLIHVPRHPILLAQFGLRAMPPAAWLARALFRDEPARALFVGIAAHATLPLHLPPSAAFGMMLGVAGHAVGWPVARGGSGAITAALLGYLRSLGGELQTGVRVTSLDELPPARTVLLDVTARQFLRLAGKKLPWWYRVQLEHFRYGLGTFKVDWALDAPIPWRAPTCARAGTVHLGGTLEEITASRQSEWSGQPADRPYVLLTQPSLFDPTRAPAGKQVGWAYCHVPNGSTADMTERIEAQVERFAPGFRNRILARHVMGPAELEAHNPNLIGGDINGGESTLLQLAFRPAIRPSPYATPLPGVYLCSSSTPPGGAVHGMGGCNAAETALARTGGRSPRRQFWGT